MTQKLAVVGAAMGVLLTASVAGAQTQGQGFGQKGEFVFSADRLVPILAFTENKISDNANNTSTSTTGGNLSLLWGNNAIIGGGAVVGGGAGAGGVAAALTRAGNPTFYTTPRVGFDYVFLPNWTLGGDLFVFFTLGGSSTTTGNPSVDTPSGNAFGVVPRIGYVFGMSQVFSIWLRGGVSFYHAGTSVQDFGCTGQSDTTSVNLFGFDIDPQLVISPAPHFAFTAGPAVDIGFAGGASLTVPVGRGNNCNTTQTTSDGYSAWNVGLTGGLLGWF
jgi:hypothetical protein